jgi:ubiquinone/menaquinone biosynthesis C-methylase UbiE
MSPAAERAATLGATGDVASSAPAVAHPALPDYLERHYRWAYLEPRNARLFDRPGFLQLLLFGFYRRLSDAVLRSFAANDRQHLLQVGCVYGDLTPRLARQNGAGRLDVADVAKVQLDLLRGKLSPDSPVTLHRRDATDLAFADASFDGVLLFFLLHEIPPAAQRRALAEALRVCRPGGRVVVIDYQRPHPLQPLRWLLPPLFRWLEPFALGFWTRPLTTLLAAPTGATVVATRSWFGGLYRQVTLTP